MQQATKRGRPRIVPERSQPSLRSELSQDASTWVERLEGVLAVAGHRLPDDWLADDDGFMWLEALPLDSPSRRRVQVIRRVLERLIGQLALVDAQDESPPLNEPGEH